MILADPSVPRPLWEVFEEAGACHEAGSVAEALDRLRRDGALHLELRPVASPATPGRRMSQQEMHTAIRDARYRSPSQTKLEAWVSPPDPAGDRAPDAL